MHVLTSPVTANTDVIESHKLSLRRLSNVAQALENLIVQCGQEEPLWALSTAAEKQLRQVRLLLLREIHG